MNIRYPNITVKLVGEDGNAYFIIGKVVDALRRNGVDKDEVSKFREEAISGGYDNLLRVCMQWVDVE